MVYLGSLISEVFEILRLRMDTLNSPFLISIRIKEYKILELSLGSICMPSSQFSIIVLVSHSGESLSCNRFVSYGKVTSDL